MQKSPDDLGVEIARIADPRQERAIQVAVTVLVEDERKYARDAAMPLLRRLFREAPTMDAGERGALRMDASTRGAARHLARQLGLEEFL